MGMGPSKDPATYVVRSMQASLRSGSNVRIEVAQQQMES